MVKVFTAQIVFPKGTRSKRSRFEDLYYHYRTGKITFQQYRVGIKLMRLPKNRRKLPEEPGQEIKEEDLEEEYDEGDEEDTWDGTTLQVEERDETLEDGTTRKVVETVDMTLLATELEEIDCGGKLGPEVTEVIEDSVDESGTRKIFKYRRTCFSRRQLPLKLQEKLALQREQQKK